MNNESRIDELTKKIAYHQNAYYNGSAEISDAAFDELWDELKQLAPDSSILKQVGTDGSDGFAKAKHILPMGSQAKAADSDEFLAWCNKVKLPEYIVEHKLDGASLELQYADGKLTKAVTRGDGVYGDDITNNAAKMKGVVADTGSDFTGAVRGEVIMTKAVHEKFFSDKANCRNAANGLMKRKDGSGSEHLSVLCYDIAPRSLYDGSKKQRDAVFLDELEKMEQLKRMGFELSETRCFKNPFDIIDYRATIAAARSGLPYDIDGLVVKARFVDVEDMKRARPERQIAFKFPLEEAVSELLDVEWSESGANYTPVGIIRPVRLAGTTVKRASLANIGILRGMELKIGSRVIVVKRGEIIPKIEGRITDGAAHEERDISIPDHCSCGAALSDDGTRLFCPNPACGKKKLHRLEKWLATLNILDFGTALLSRLFDAGRVLNISDLYTITAEELAGYERMGKTSAVKVINNLHAKNEISLPLFIAGFDIEGIGKLTIEKAVQAGFDALRKLREASAAQLSSVDGFGDITAAALQTGLKDLAFDMDAVLAFVRIHEAPQGGALSGISFCFTGELVHMKRNEAASRVNALGGTVKNSVTKGLHYLVTNDPASGSEKNKKAASLGVQIIDEQQFLDMLAAAVTH